MRIVIWRANGKDWFTHNCLKKVLQVVTTMPVVYFWMGLLIKWKYLSQSVHPWQMIMWTCLLLLVLWPVHLYILSFSLPLFPCWNIWFSPSRQTQQLILLKLKLLKVTPTPTLLLSRFLSRFPSLFPDQRWFPGSGGCSSQPLAGKLSLFVRPSDCFEYSAISYLQAFFSSFLSLVCLLEGQANVFVFVLLWPDWVWELASLTSWMLWSNSRLLD